MVARVAPGDPARVAAGPDATEEMVQTIREEFGLNKNLFMQYIDYIKGLMTGNLGRSIRTQHDVVADLIRLFQTATFELTVFSLLLAVALGIPLGVICAVYRDGLSGWPPGSSGQGLFGIRPGPAHVLVGVDAPADICP